LFILGQARATADFYYQAYLGCFLRPCYYTEVIKKHKTKSRRVFPKVMYRDMRALCNWHFVLDTLSIESYSN